MFKREIVVKVSKDFTEAKLRIPLIIYNGDFGIKYSFTIKQSQYFNVNETNLFSNLDNAYADIRIIDNNGITVYTENNLEVDSDKILFTYTKEVADVLEGGEYKIEFLVGDTIDNNDTAMFTIPAFSFKVLARQSGITSINNYTVYTTEENIIYLSEEGTVICPTA